MPSILRSPDRSGGVSKGRPAHASVSIAVAGEGRRVLRLLNDTHHLTTAEGDFASY